MSYPSSKRRLRPARGIALLVSALMAGGMGLGALTSSAQAAVLPTSGPTGNVQSMAGTMQNYAQWGPCTATSCPGDGGPSTAAQLYNPRALAFAPNGDIYIADALNERIRKVDIATEGEVTAFTIVAFAAPGVPVPFVAAIVDCGGTSVRSTLTNVPADPEHVTLGMKVRLTTVPIGTDDAGTEAVTFAFEPA